VVAIREVNAQALYVVAAELTTTLNDARVALEASLEQPGDPEPMLRVAELLGQARGVLRLVEVYGGALLAEEMEQTARFLARGSDARQQADGLDALMRAVVQLPAYLERVLGGGRDLALVLLPLLNDLRAVRGASLLSEGTLLSLNLTSEQAPRATAMPYGEEDVTVPQRARRLRPRFQVALLGLIRGDTVAPHLEHLAEVAEQIEAAATTGPLFQLWWVVGAVIEALRAGGLEESASVKRLLGQADRELRRLYEQGEQRYSESPPIDLLNNLLFYVARATSDGPRISAVRSSFRLDELLPADETVAQEQESLSGPSVKLMHTVADAIKEDLGRVKDALDLFTRQGGQPEELGPQVELLRKIGETLAVLGLGSSRERVQAELGRLSAMAERKLPAERDALIGIAAALISVEDSLDDSLVQLIMPPGQPAEGVIQDPEFRQVAEAVLRECGVNLARIKEIMSQALEPGADVVGLDAVRPLARGVTAGLLMLGKTRAMEIMERIAHHVVTLLAPGADAPPKAVDRLADAIVGIEYYMETLQAGRGDPWYMLDNAERCLTVIDSRLAPAPETEAAEPAEDLTGTTVVIERPPEVVEEPAFPAAAEAIPPPAMEEAATPSARVAETAEAATEAVPGPQPEALDPELLEVFIEEAREEIEAIGRMFPLWAENPSDRESLVRVRRAFHTLKGSGRMVGAMALGEFAWSVEDLLNRVIEGTRERTPEMVAVLREAAERLPAMVDAVERHAPLPEGTDGLVATVRAMAAGEELPVAPAAAREVEPGYEPTLMVATLDEETMARMLESVPPVEARAPVPPEAQAWEAAQAAAGEEPEAAREPGEPAGAEALEEEAHAVAEPAWEAPAEEMPPEEADIWLEEEVVSAEVDEAEVWLEEEVVSAEVEEDSVDFEEIFAGGSYASMDPSLQDIFRKEVQTHLEVFRDFLRRSWVAPGPHHVTDELYRACHTLRGASRTAEAEECIRLADPLHRWLRRLFDADRAFDDEGLGGLADAVAAFEDIVESRGSVMEPPPGLNDVIRRLSALDLALEQSITREQAEPIPPPEPTPQPEPVAEAPEEPAPEKPLEIDHLIPEISVESDGLRAQPGAGYDRLLPAREDEQAVGGEIPYLSRAEEGAPEEAPPGEGVPPAEELRLPSVIDEVARDR
jgi:chemosensory pili system protein ChpA (sensor histidine kinase/response regulator)